MLEFLRKHTLVVMAAMVLVFFGLIFIESNSNPISGGGAMIAKVGDTSYSFTDYESISGTGIRLAAQCPSLRNMVEELTICRGTSDPGVAFLANYGIIRLEAQRYGVEPSSLEIDETIKAMPEFQAEKGGFDVERYREFLSIRGKNLIGEVEESFRSVVANSIRLQRLKSILTDNLVMNQAFSKSLFESLNQQMSVNTAFLEKDKFKPATSPGEEEIKAFWEKRKQNYLNDESRSLTLYIFKPKAAIVADPNSKIPAATLEVLTPIENLWQQIADANANGMDEMIAKTVKDASALLTIETKEFKDITKKEILAILQSPLNPAAGAQQANLAEVAFSLAPSVAQRERTEEELKESQKGNSPAPAATESKPNAISADNISNALVLEDGSIALICIREISPIKPLPFERARAAARADLMNQMTEEAMEKAGKELATQLSALKDGAEFAKTAAARGAKTKSWGPYTTNTPPDDMPEATTIFRELRKVNPGESAEPIHTGDGIIIAQLQERTITDTPELRAMENSVTGFLDMQMKRMLLEDWLENCFDKYKVSFPTPIHN